MNGRKRNALRKIGHPMRPLMRLGSKGIADGFVAELSRALDAHQLVKVRLDVGGKEETRERADALAAAAEAEVVDVVGSSALLYREDPEDPLVRE